MRSRKLLALILAICLVFSFSGCDIINSIIETATAQPEKFPETNSPTTPSGGSGNSGGSSGDNGGSNNSSGNTGNNGDNTGNNGGNGSDESSFINVIMINDNHGILNEDDGSLDKIASGISYYESLGDVVKIANGDMFQGTYVSSTLRGLPMLEALNALDFDAFVIGNHEFDWGFDEMKKYKDGDPTNGEADFPFLGANIYDRRTGEMVEWLEAYTIVEIGEIRIGIIGIIGDVESSILSSNVADYDFVDARNIVKSLAGELRGEKDCDVVIVAEHGDDDSLNYTLATYEGDYRIDGIFTGHTHSPTDREVTRADGESICVLQNGGYGQSFATLTLEFDENGTLSDTDGNLNYTYNYTANGILSPVFEKYAEYIAIGNTVMFTADESLDRYDVGIYVAYSMYSKYSVDLAVINSGGVRTSIDAGEVTYAEVFQVLPFENEVYIVTLSGEMLRSYLNNAGGIYYWGIYQEYIVDTEYYTLAIVDYVYLGSYFANYRNDTCVDTNDLIRDVFIDWLLATV